MSPAQVPNKKPNPPYTVEDLPHRWIVNAQVEVDDKTAKHAAFRGSFWIEPENGRKRVEALDVICMMCRRNRDDVHDQPCSARINNQHLIGGDQRERMKRNTPNLPLGAVVVAGPRIDRRGVDAVLRREA